MDPNKNVSVIQGANGAGKSNLLNSITWCFYGVEEHLEKYEGSRQSIANDEVLHSLASGEKAQVYVEVKLVDNSGRVNIFRRDAWVRKDDIEPTKTEFQGWIKTSDKLVRVSEPNFMVERILPERISSFFFFDGERLDDFFKTSQFNLVKDAVYEVSHLNLLESGIHHLNETIRKIRGRVKRLTPEVENIEEKITSTDEGIEILKEEYSEKKDELKDVRDRREKISSKIDSSSDQIVKRLKSERDRSLRNLKRIEEMKEKAEQKLVDSVIAIGPYPLFKPSIQAALNVILQKTDKGELPPRIKKPFVEELLQRDICICNRELDAESRAAVHSLLDEVRMSEIAQDLTEMKFHLQSALDRIQSFPSEIEELREDILGYKNTIEEERSAIREIDTKLKKADSEEDSDAAYKLSQIENKETELVKSLGIVESKLKRADSLLKQYNREFRRALAESERHNREFTKLEVAMEMYEILEKVYESMIEKTRAKVERLTREYFLSLIWKKETYIDVFIDQNYQISVINSYGEDCLGSLSAGEREVLALSFLAAVREISGFEAPIIIDTPLAKISREPKENIARLLPKFFENTQVTLFVTEEEYTDSVKENLRPKIGREYELSYLDSEHRTEVNIIHA